MVDFILRTDVVRVVRQTEEGIPAFEPAAAQQGKGIVLTRREEVRAQPVDHCLQFPVAVVVVVRVVATGTQRFNLFHGQAEDEDVVVTDFLTDFDVGTIQGTDGHRAVEGKLHVTGTGGFLTRGGDLLGDIGCRDHALSQADTVVLGEDDLELTIDARVVVDLLGNLVDRADDIFGQRIARCRLGAKDEDARIIA